MYRLIMAQVNSLPPVSGETVWFDRFPTDQIMVMFIVFVVFTTLLLVSIAWFVTGTIRTVCVARANARLAEKLSGNGIPPEQIERIVRANWRHGRLLGLLRPFSWSRWQSPAANATVRKPVPPIARG